jgi:hypothetical protein
MVCTCIKKFRALQSVDICKQIFLYLSSYNFVQEFKSTVKSGSRGIQQNLFCNFWTFLQVSMNFGSLKQFLELKQLKNHLKTLHSVGPQISPCPAAHGRNWPSPVGRATRGTSTMRWARSLRGAHARGGAVARRQGARRWTGRGKVLGSSTTAKRRLRGAKRAEVGLTEEVGRRWVAESGRRSGGGRLRRGGSALGAVLRLEAKVRGKTTGATSEQRRKHGAGERNLAGGRR